jgi:hypothetical protein
MVGQLGRPSRSFVEKLVAAEPYAQAGLTGTGECDFYEPDGALVAEHVDTLTSIIDDYEAEQARVCARCRTAAPTKARAPRTSTA